MKVHVAEDGVVHVELSSVNVIELIEQGTELIGQVDFNNTAMSALCIELCRATLPNIMQERGMNRLIHDLQRGYISAVD